MLRNQRFQSAARIAVRDQFKGLNRPYFAKLDSVGILWSLFCNFLKQLLAALAQLGRRLSLQSLRNFPSTESPGARVLRMRVPGQQTLRYRGRQSVARFVARSK